MAEAVARVPGEFPTRYLGIDPGVTGALAVLSPLGLGEIVDAPVVITAKRKRDFDVAAMRRILLDCQSLGDPCVAVIEEVHGWPGMDVRSVTSLVRGAALWEGLCAGLGIPVRRIAPRAWKQHAQLLRSEKRASRVRAAQQFPLADLGPKASTGRAEALLIAAYGRAMAY